MKKFLCFSFLFFAFIFFSYTISLGATVDLEFSDGNTYSFEDFSDIVEGKEYCIIYGTNKNVGSKFVLYFFDPNTSVFRLRPAAGYYYMSLYPPDKWYENDNDRISFDYYYCNAQRSSWNIETNNVDSSFYFNKGITAVYTTFDLYDAYTKEIVYKKNSASSFIAPFIANNKEDLSSCNYDYITINAGSYTYYDCPDINFVIRQVVQSSSDTDYEAAYIRYNTVLNANSKYVRDPAQNTFCIFDIPFKDLGINFSNNEKYIFSLEYYQGDQYITDDYTITISGLTVEDQQLNSDKITQEKLDQTNEKLDETNKKLDETNKNTKGIWDSLMSIFDLLNPFSPNFFVYKLIELLVEAIKSLFLPGDGFFDNYFTELKEWFSDRLGFLFYPFELILDILDKILHINFSEPIFNIPDINEPFTNTKLITATTYNLNSLLENGTFKTIHDFYLIGVDAIIVFGLVNLAKRKWEEVTRE